MGEAARMLGQWGYLGIFLSVALGSAGFPIPEDPVHLAAGYLAAGGHLRLPTVLIVGLASVMAADQTGYWVARHVRGRRAGGRRDPSKLTIRLEAALRKHGLLGVFAARFLPGVRGLAGPAAGLVGVPPLQFVAANTCAAAMHVSLLVGTGYTLAGEVTSQALARVLGPLIAFAAGTGVCGLVVLAVNRRWLRLALRPAGGVSRNGA